MSPDPPSKKIKFDPPTLLLLAHLTYSLDDKRDLLEQALIGLKADTLERAECLKELGLLIGNRDYVEEAIEIYKSFDYYPNGYAQAFFALAYVDNVVELDECCKVLERLNEPTNDVLSCFLKLGQRFTYDYERIAAVVVNSIATVRTRRKGKLAFTDFSEVEGLALIDLRHTNNNTHIINGLHLLVHGVNPKSAYCNYKTQVTSHSTHFKTEAKRYLEQSYDIHPSEHVAELLEVFVISDTSSLFSSDTT